MPRAVRPHSAAGPHPARRSGEETQGAGQRAVYTVQTQTGGWRGQRARGGRTAVSFVDNAELSGFHADFVRLSFCRRRRVVDQRTWMDDSAWMDEIVFQEGAVSRTLDGGFRRLRAQFGRRGGLCGVGIQGVVDGRRADCTLDLGPCAVSLRIMGRPWSACSDVTSLEPSCACREREKRTLYRLPD